MIFRPHISGIAAPSPACAKPIKPQPKRSKHEMAKHHRAGAGDGRDSTVRPSPPGQASHGRCQRLLRHVPRPGPRQRGPARRSSETEGSLPEWSRVYVTLGGDSAFELMQGDLSRQPEVVRRFVDVFLAAHHQRCWPRRIRKLRSRLIRSGIASTERRRPYPSSCPPGPNVAGPSPSGCYRRGLGQTVKSMNPHRPFPRACGLTVGLRLARTLPDALVWRIRVSGGKYPG